MRIFTNPRNAIIATTYFLDANISRLPFILPVGPTTALALGIGGTLDIGKTRALAILWEGDGDIQIRSADQQHSIFLMGDWEIGRQNIFLLELDEPMDLSIIVSGGVVAGRVITISS